MALTALFSETNKLMFPGPFFARFTRLWELHAVRRGGFEKTHIALHEQHGPIVRLAPNRYSISDAKEADQIYRHGSKFVKADFYHAFGNPNPVGRSFGFMEKGYDFNGILQAIHASMTYGSRVGLLPEFHPFFAWMARTTKQPIPFDTVQGFIDGSVEIRKQGGFPTDREDFLTKLLSLRKSEKINDLDVATSLGANIAAGSDTTAISLSTVIYHMARNPAKAGKLRQEIREHEESKTVSDPVTFKEAQDMPYLQAVIKEALRIHPVTGQILSRLVPSGGATICGRYFPEGTEVGTSPWLTHFDEDIFGANAHSFIPERWLEDKDRASVMNQHMLAVSLKLLHQLAKI
ncbi:cytochrome protein [Aureobasidium pullulans]|nr:cytochrome protein [Aureobasidium pullulans]